MAKAVCVIDCSYNYRKANVCVLLQLFFQPQGCELETISCTLLTLGYIAGGRDSDLQKDIQKPKKPHCVRLCICWAL